MIRLLLLFIITSTTYTYSQTANYPPDAGEYSHYITKSGDTISVGDKVELGIPFGGTIFLFLSQDAIHVKSRLAGDIVTITKLVSASNNKTSYKMQAYFKGYGMLPIVIDLENALKTEEVILLNQ